MQGKITRAFDVMDIDITNSARFGTKGLGSALSHESSGMLMGVLVTELC